MPAEMIPVFPIVREFAIDCGTEITRRRLAPIPWLCIRGLRMSRSYTGARFRTASDHFDVIDIIECTVSERGDNSAAKEIGDNLLCNHLFEELQMEDV